MEIQIARTGLAFQSLASCSLLSGRLRIAADIHVSKLSLKAVAFSIFSSNAPVRVL